jgi:outer membrane protein assembly factor BamB
MKHRNLKTAFLALLAAGLVSAPFARADDWYQWRGPHQNGVSDEKNLPEDWNPDAGENVAWVNKVGGMSSPIVMNGKVYTWTRAGEVEAADTLVSGFQTQEAFVAIDANTGKTLWQHLEPMTQTDVPFHRLGWGNPVGDPKTGRVYGLGSQCTLVCLDGNTGKVVWRRQMTEEFGLISTFGGRTPTPALDPDGNQLYLAGVAFGWGDHARSQYRCFAFDRATGELLWSNGTGGIPVDSPYQTPVIATINGQKLVITGAGDGSVTAFQANTGKKAWSHKVSKRGLNTSVVVDEKKGRVYAGHSEENLEFGRPLGAVVCIDASGPQPKDLWRNEGTSVGFSSPALVDNVLYCVDNSGVVYALNGDDGKEIWKKRAGTIGKASVVYGDGKLYIAEANGRFIILQPQSGNRPPKQLSKQDIEEKFGREYSIFGSPAISNGRIYLQAANRMFCIGPKGEAKAQAGAAPGEARTAGATEQVK